MKPSKKLSLSTESLRALTVQESTEVAGGYAVTRYRCNSNYTCVTDCGGSVCASACNGHVCP